MSGKRIVIGRKPPARLPEALYGRVRQILESARTSAARSVNTAQVVANWMVGREIVEEEQHAPHLFAPIPESGGHVRTKPHGAGLGASFRLRSACRSSFAFLFE